MRKKKLSYSTLSEQFPVLKRKRMALKWVNDENTAFISRLHFQIGYCRRYSIFGFILYDLWLKEKVCQWTNI